MYHFQLHVPLVLKRDSSASPSTLPEKLGFRFWRHDSGKKQAFQWFSYMCKAFQVLKSRVCWNVDAAFLVAQPFLHHTITFTCSNKLSHLSQDKPPVRITHEIIVNLLNLRQ